MCEQVNTVAVMPPFQRLEHLNDELLVIRRVLNRPDARPETMDLLRMGVDYTHARYESLAFEMRRDQAAAQVAIEARTESA